MCQRLCSGPVMVAHRLAQMAGNATVQELNATSTSEAEGARVERAQRILALVRMNQQVCLVIAVPVRMLSMILAASL